MIGRDTKLTVTRPTASPLGRLRRTLVVAVIIVGTGAVGPAASLAGAGSQPRPPADQDEYVLPSKQVMREMRSVIMALYGARPAASRPTETQAGRGQIAFRRFLDVERTTGAIFLIPADRFGDRVGTGVRDRRADRRHRDREERLSPTPGFGRASIGRFYERPSSESQRDGSAGCGCEA
jgi:hypothetical protein